MERFIRDNRESFDVHQPGAKVWEQIEKEIGRPKPEIRIIRIAAFRWSAAAAVLILLSLAAWLFTRDGQESVTNTPSMASRENAATAPAPESQDPLVAEIDPQYARMVAQFNGMIEAKQQEIRAIEKDNPELFRQFSGDIRKLDSTYQVLRNTLSANPNKEQLLQAMIGNLQMQINLLNQQLQIIQQVKKPKSSNT
jgi:hypothetical protein